MYYFVNNMKYYLYLTNIYNTQTEEQKPKNNGCFDK